MSGRRRAPRRSARLGRPRSDAGHAAAGERAPGRRRPGDPREMEAAAPAAAEAAGREELGGCCVRAAVRAAVERGCASAGCAAVPAPELGLGGGSDCGRLGRRRPHPGSSGLPPPPRPPAPRQGETPVFFLLSRGLGVKAQGIVVWHRFEFKTQQSKPP